MLQTKNANYIQHSSEKEFIYLKVHLSIRLQLPQFQGLIWLLLISYLNQQTVVYSFIGAKLNRQLQGGYSYKNLQHKFKFCLYLQNGLIKYPSYLQVSSATHATRVFSNVNSTIHVLCRIKISFCHDVDSQSFTSVDEMHEHPACRQLLGTMPGSSTKGFVCSNQLGKYPR